MTLLASKHFTTAKKLPPVGFNLKQGIITDLRVQCLTNSVKLAFACKSETFRSLNSYTLLILGESSKGKDEVQHDKSDQIPSKPEPHWR